MESKARKYLTIIALGLAGGSIYFIPYVKYVFYDAQLAAIRTTTPLAFTPRTNPLLMSSPAVL